MSYKSWFETHAKKHKKIVDKLAHLSDDEVIAYFDFDNMVKNEPDFCPLYKDNKKCHDTKELNCYLCACPNFRFDDESIKEIVLDGIKIIYKIYPKSVAIVMIYRYIDFNEEGIEID